MPGQRACSPPPPTTTPTPRRLRYGRTLDEPTLERLMAAGGLVVGGWKCGAVVSVRR